MKLIPVFTEKSTKLASAGKYTFMVPVTLTKLEIKKAIDDIFDVHVKTIKTVNSKKSTKRNMRGKMVTIPATKKAIVSLKEGQKIELFTEEKKSSKGRSASGRKRSTK